MTQFRRSYQESRIQKAIVTHFRGTYEGEICRVGKGGEEPPLPTFRSENECEVAGPPVVVIYPPGQTAILMEVKAATGTLSLAQKAFHRRLQDMGFIVVTVHSAEDAKRAFQE